MAKARAGSGTARMADELPAIETSVSSRRTSCGRARRSDASVDVGVVTLTISRLPATLRLSDRPEPQDAASESIAGGRVEPVLGGGHADLEDGLDGVGGQLDRHPECLAVGLPRPAQHVVGPLLAPGRLPDADPDAHEVVAVQMGLDRLEAVVTGQPAAHLDAQHTDRQVELVVHDHETVQVVDPVPAHQRRDDHAGVVHVGLGECQGHPLGPDASLVDERALLALLEAPAVARRQQGDDVGTGVVSGALELGAGIAEPDDQQVGKGPRVGPEQLQPSEPPASSPPAAASPPPSPPAASPSPASAAASAAASSSASTSAAKVEADAMTTASSGSTSVVTPSGSFRSPTRMASPICSALMSTSIDVGMRSGVAWTVRE